MIKVEVLRAVELPTIQRLVQLESEAFGCGGMNEWHLVPFIRHGRVFIARIDREIVGAVQYMLDWNTPAKAYMMGVSITSKMRGRGLGTELITCSLQQLASENIKEVELTVDPANTAALRVYEKKLGFAAQETRADEYGKGEHRTVMILTLPAGR